ncbi:MAG TPA: MFS transporter [Clostridiales bacterium]|nr:MFS transporter [Clostridiales bacterium]
MSLFERIVACSGGMTAAMDLLMVQTFLLYFYTDVVKINAAIVGTIFLVVRIISAIAAPAFGIFVDKTTTPWGKYRPYYIIMGIPTALFGFLTFTTWDMGRTGVYVYIIITYFLYSIFCSIGGVPKSAMGPLLTKNTEDRMSMGLLGYIFAVSGSVIAVSGTPFFVRILGGDNEAKGFRMTMAIFAAFAILIALLQAAVLKEKYPPLKRAHSSGYTIKQMLGAVFHNKTAVIVFLLSLSINLSTGLRSSVSMHYLKYYLLKPDLMAQVGLLTMVGLFIGAMLSPMLTKRIGLRNNLVMSTIVAITTSALIFVIPARSYGIYVYILLLFISNFFNGLSTPAQGTLMPNAIDYTEWKTGMNVGAFMSSLNSFIGTAGTAFSGVVVGILLTTFGYQAGVEQSGTALMGIRLLMSLLPAIAGILALASLWLGDTEKQHERIARDLIEGRD